jgi:hypothetical protein
VKGLPAMGIIYHIDATQLVPRFRHVSLGDCLMWIGLRWRVEERVAGMGLGEKRGNSLYASSLESHIAGR